MSMTINAANYLNGAIQNTRTTGSEKSEQKGGASEAGKTKQTAARRMDTVEISKEGQVASAKLQEQSTDTAAAEEYQYEAEDLSEYTDTELKQMYYNGEITRQEYEDETGEALE